MARPSGYSGSAGALEGLRSIKILLSVDLCIADYVIVQRTFLRLSTCPILFSSIML